MFVKIGEPNPITIVETVDQTDSDVRLSLKRTIKAVKNKQVKEVPVKKESETK